MSTRGSGEQATAEARAAEARTPKARLRQAGLALSLLAGLVLVMRATDQAQGLGSWLVWRYLVVAGLALFWTAACLSGGYVVTRRLLKDGFTFTERVFLGFGIGVILFGGAIELLGFAHLLRAPVFVLLPLLFVGVGLRPLFVDGRSFVRHFGRVRRPWNTLELALGAATLVGVILLYAKIVSPAHAGYDSRWYHLPVAEDYVATASVHAFREGWILGAYPQLMTFLYTWAFLWPGQSLFNHVALAGHVELVLLLVGLGAIPLVVRRVAPGARSLRSLPLAFAFPCLFMYGPQCEADMLALMFGSLNALAVLRFWRRPTRERALAIGLTAAGLLITKYSTACVLAPAGVIVAVRFLLPAKSFAWRERLQSAAVLGAGFLAASSFHWGKNWVFYGDPIFPLLVNKLAAHPLTHQGREILKWFWPHEVWRPPANMEGVKESLVTAWTFAFTPHEYVSIGHGWPLFGFLFTCGLIALPFLAPRIEAWLLGLGCTLGVFTWFWVHHQDRYLQTLFGWMVPVAFAALHTAWKSGKITRALAAGLLTLQVAWGGDVFFHHAPVSALVSLISSAREGPDARRGEIDIYRPMSEVRRELPPHANVLLHDMHDHVGLGHASVSDFAGWQTGISYVEASTPADVHELLARKMRVTHLLWKDRTSAGMSSLGADLAFFRYVQHFAQNRRNVGPFVLADIPAAAPARQPGPDRVLVSLCEGSYGTGIYDLGALDMRTIDPPPAAEYPAPVEAASGTETVAPPGVASVAVDTRCRARPAFLDSPSPPFDLVARRDSVELWVRRN